MKPKLNYVVLERAKELIPKWLFRPENFAMALDKTMTDLIASGVPFSMSPDYWIELDVEAGTMTVKDGGLPEGIPTTGIISIYNYKPIIGSASQIQIPLYAFFMTNADMVGRYSVYYHGIQTDVPLYYVGLTQQSWYARFNQHIAAAKGNSPLIFHQALREHRDKVMIHKVIIHGIDKDSAMDSEEKFVDLMSLYPKGLNMIPGGYAGFRYLGSLGYEVSSEKQRSRALLEIVKLTDIKGRPNPLCASRWASDQDYINRVICGHTGRLTVAQVKDIRLLNGFGKNVQYIAQSTGIANLSQINNVMRNKRYSRVL